MCWEKIRSKLKMIKLRHPLNFGPHFSRDKFCDAKLTNNEGLGFISVHKVILSAVSVKFGKIFEANLSTTADSRC